MSDFLHLHLLNTIFCVVFFFLKKLSSLSKSLWIPILFSNTPLAVVFFLSCLYSHSICCQISNKQWVVSDLGQTHKEPLSVHFYILILGHFANTSPVILLILWDFQSGPYCLCLFFRNIAKKAYLKWRYMKFYYFYPLCNNYYFTVKGYQISLTEFVLDKFMLVITNFLWTLTEVLLDHFHKVKLPDL